jgi:hypothetical protein
MNANATLLDRNHAGGDAVVVACEQPGRNRYLSFVEAGNPRLREHRWLLDPFRDEMSAQIQVDPPRGMGMRKVFA